MSSQLDAGALSRRQLLKRGAFGSLILGTASSSAFLSGCASKTFKSSLNPAPQSIYQFLRQDDVRLISAIAPVIIDQHWPQPETEATQARDLVLERTDLFITRLGDHNMREIRQLFDLLNQRMTRGLTTGLWSPWQEQDPSDIEDFLEDWKSSRFSLFTSAYNALTDIIGFAWYSAPQNTARLGYAGPPAYLYEALPHLQEGRI